MRIARQTWFCPLARAVPAVTQLVANTQGWDITENYVTLIVI